MEGNAYFPMRDVRGDIVPSESAEWGGRGVFRRSEAWQGKMLGKGGPKGGPLLKSGPNQGQGLALETAKIERA